MAYIVWLLLGLGVAALAGTGLRRLTFRTSWMAGACGGLLGGIISDGVPHHSGVLTGLSIVGALAGALLLCWAMRDGVQKTE
jgi:hypothetical protein